MRTLTICLTLLASMAGASKCAAGYPFFSKFTTPADGPYAPRVNRYIVVDPTPVAPSAAHHGHHAAAPTGPLWARHNADQPAYPYGWFGARAATKNWSQTGYYDNYVDKKYLRGN